MSSNLNSRQFPTSPPPGERTKPPHPGGADWGQKGWKGRPTSLPPSERSAKPSRPGWGQKGWK